MTVFLIVIIETEQLVLPLFARLTAVLSGLTTSFFRKGDLVMMETEGDGSMSMKIVSIY
jgi:hypothetical protein